MAWTTPKTWSSEPLTSIDLNTYVRDNQHHLKDRLDNAASRSVSGAVALASTSSEFVDVDPTNLSLTLTTHGGDVLLGFTGTLKHSGSNATTYFNVSVDGVDYIPDDGIIAYAGASDTSRFKPLSFVLLIAPLSPGNHAFNLRWKTSRSNTARMDIVDLHPQFWAKEI